ncbi:hypothetical protein BTJ40_14315 [Microbulbifer sp. A4B17]|uniref:hypothetical protein n=1 Tax=Microbulbifer sp. A4B17 TaxID=359370 RepID=UPI000D52DDED|nr:hypothetical protein [Microbulbifer sp. A4B17]AWF81902.1 hypothetical protein BTJ40_14315 [Microbulbifer sp. A4B17]
MIQFDKLVFLDVDTLVSFNIDHLMNYPESCEAPNLYEEWDGFHRTNSGLFTAVPSEVIYQKILE